jgi:hypothetical protein
MVIVPNYVAEWTRAEDGALVSTVAPGGWYWQVNETNSADPDGHHSLLLAESRRSYPTRAAARRAHRAWRRRILMAEER